MTAHRAVGAALGGCDVEEDDADLGEVGESASELSGTQLDSGTLFGLTIRQQPSETK